jgi:hypothetical protein
VPNYEGSPLVCGPEGGVSSAKGAHEFKARAGHHLVPQNLSSGKDVFDELGDNFTLLAFGAGPDFAAAFRNAADELNIPLTIVEDSFEDGRKDYETPAILVRPDHFITWAGDADPDRAMEILQREIGCG